jgi:hypothetical protein
VIISLRGRVGSDLDRLTAKARVSFSLKILRKAR